jgi:hypothetical protein
MTNYVSVLYDAIGVEAAQKAIATLRRAGYVIYKGDPDTEINGLRAEIRKLRAEVSRSSYHCD